MKREMRRKFIQSTVLLIIVLCWAAVPGWTGRIMNSKHNLSSASPSGGIKASDTDMICIFCHTSHSGKTEAPLWNREDSKVIYNLYDSSTLYSSPDQPDGASKLCLSCHDGTIALGKVISRGKEFAMSNTSLGRIPPQRKSNLGSDLSDDHPISFHPAAAVNNSMELVHPAPLDPVTYDGNGKMQCTTCHDPHDDGFKKFLVKSNQNGELCKSCHQLTDYNGIASHDISVKKWNGTQENPWPHSDYLRVVDNSCMNCHRSHSASGKERLLDGVEENVCLKCHNGSVGRDIKNLLRKTSAHRVEAYQGGHDPTENIITAPEHVECVDCHHPHRSNSSSAAAPLVPGSLSGVSGMTVTGSLKETAQYEYEVCLKCHGQDKYRAATTIKRMEDTSNIRVAINPGSASFHPIAAPGNNHWVPSLKPPYTTVSRIYCGDCHNSDSSARAGGDGPDGPHGSRYEYILERQYLTTDYTNWSEAHYALCYKCHNPISLFDRNLGGFVEHETHIRDANTPCSVCHDPHGSPRYVGLLNFDTNVVFPNMNGELRFEVIGDTGYCYMQCHGKDHSPKEYIRK